MERGKQPLVVLLPEELDLAALSEGRELPYQSLKDGLIDRGISAIDLADTMAAKLESHDIEELFIDGYRHYTPLGYRLLANAVEKWIRNTASSPN